MKKWKCTVCNYVHEGDDPPSKCPVCGVGKEKFVHFEDGAEQGADKLGADRIAARKNAILKHHVHPMTVHVPNGVVPISFFFVIVAAVLGFAGLNEAAFYNYIMVLAAMPVVLYSGWVEWKKRYKGAWSSQIALKLLCAGIVTLGVAALVVWHIYDPGVLSAGSAGKWLYVSLNGIVMGATSIAGFVGGKMVFKD